MRKLVKMMSVEQREPLTILGKDGKLPLEEKIILCKGEAFTPPRFWKWIVITEAGFTEIMKNYGWVKSDCTKYLSSEQLANLRGSNELNETIV